jgi:predicted metal-binding membrane protein
MPPDTRVPGLPQTRVRPPLERGQLVLLALLILVTAGAWTLTVYQAGTMTTPMEDVAGGGMADHAALTMGGMAGDTGSWTAFAAFLAAWAVMMAAMMFPAAAPMLLLFQRVATQRRAAGAGFVPTWVFAAAYLLVWTATGIVTWAIIRFGDGLAARLAEADRATWAPRALGATLVVAGLYQLSPLKRVCLHRCRTPLDFVITHWRDGVGGALRMGVRHGAYCLGCCWALFAVLVAAGMMNLAWMLLLTAVIFAEKVLPVGEHAAVVVGIAFIAAGIVVTVMP